MYNKGCEHYWAESDYLPVAAVLDYWCSGDFQCKESKKFAIISACEKNLIQYKRTDGKNFNDPVNELIGRGIIVIHRESFEKWAKGIDQNVALNLPLDQRSETTYLNIIGALLECITGTFKDKDFSSEAKLREFVEKKFEGLRGTKARTTAEKFSLAKKSLDNNL